MNRVHRSDRSKATPARVVDEDVQPTEFLDSSVYESLHLRRVAHVRLEYLCLSATRTDARGHRLRFVLRLRVVDRHGRAICRKSFRDCGADATCCPRHKCDLPLKLFHFLLLITC